MVDTSSMFNTAPPAPFNPLQQASSVAGFQGQQLQNQQLQQQVQQAQIQTQIAQGKQRVGQIISKNTDPDGTVHWLNVQSDAAKDPLASHPEVFNGVLNLVNNQLAATPAGIGSNNAPIVKSLQNVNRQLGGNQPQQPTGGGPVGTPGAPQGPTVAETNNQSSALAAPSGNTIQTGVTPGAIENVAARQKHYLDVQDAASSVPTENAALNNILNLSKGGAPSGSKIGQVYKTLAGLDPSVFPSFVTDPAEQLGLMKSHMSQLALAGGMPGSDARLTALQDAKVGDESLPAVIQGMVPYLLAVNKGKVAQADYYQRTAGDGTDPQKVAQAQANWRQNFDPRLLEMNELTSDPVALKKYTSTLSKQDKAELTEKLAGLRKMGVLPNPTSQGTNQ